MYNYLWLGKTGESNAWYHISLVVHTKIVRKLFVVRNKRPQKEIISDKIKYFESGRSYFILFELIKLMMCGYKALRQNKIDVIITFNVFPYGFLSYLLAIIFRKKLVLCFIGKDYNTHFKRLVTRYLMLKSLRYTEVIICKGRHMRDGLLKYGINEDKIHYYPHFVDDKFLEIRNHDINTEYDIITVCQLIARKNLQLLIKGIHRLKNEDVKLRVCIVGSGPLYSNLINMVNELNLKHNIYFVGFQKNIKTFIDKSKIFIQTSSAEGLSLSLVEAIASGLVPIVTEAGSERDIVTDGYNGIIFKKNSVEDLVRAVKEVLNPIYYTYLRSNVLNERNKYSLANATSISNSILKNIHYDK